MRGEPAPYFDYSYDEDIVWCYDAYRNILVDYDGCEVFNMFKFITPSMLQLMKAKKDDMIFRGKYGERIVILYDYPDYGY